MASEFVHEFNDTNFQAEVLQSSVPVLVDFWAEWCGPCRMLAPTVEEIAKEYQGKLKVGKVNVDAAAQTAMQYSIQSIPTLILFVGGEIKTTLVGAMPKAQLLARIAPMLAS